MTTETRCFNVQFKTYCFREPLRYNRTAAMGKHGNTFFSSFIFFFTRPQAAQLVFLAENCQHVDKNELVRRRAYDLDID